MNLQIPPRSQSGTRLRLRGKGVERKDRRGDLYAELLIQLPKAGDQRLAEATEEAGPLYDTPVRKGIYL